MSDWRLTLFGDDDETPLVGSVDADGAVVEASCSTEPGHPRPYLMVPESFAESEVDLAEGRSVIGQVNVRVLDRRRGAGQETGWLTALLATAEGYSALNGRRALVEQRDGAAGTWHTLMDGVVGGVTLGDDYVTYALELRDIRERERKVKAFTSSDTATIFPRGVLGGYGRRDLKVADVLNGTFAQNAGWLIPPTPALRGVYHNPTGDHTWGEVDLSRLWNGRRVPPYLVVTKKMRDVLKPESRVVKRLGSFKEYQLVYPNARVLWRYPGQPWHTIRAPQRLAWSKGGMIRTRRAYTEDDGPSLRAARAIVVGSADPGELPQGGRTVEVIVAYNGPPSEEYPYHLEGITAGLLLKRLYDGYYSPGEALLKVRYDEEALLRLDTPVRARISEAVDDLRQWVEENVYRPLGAAPAIDERGRISPIRYALPVGDDPDGLPELTPANTAPGAGWEHSAGEAVNHVVVTYARDYRVSDEDDPEGEVAAGDGLAEMETTVEHLNVASIALLGEKKLELEMKLFRAVGGDDGSVLGGDVHDETGFLLAQERAAQAMDRFVFGAQTITARCTRRGTAGLRVGDWVVVSLPWLPEYRHGLRGSNRLAQVVSIKDLDPAWRELRLLDAGPAAQPVDQPVLGIPTAQADGVVVVPVWGIAPGTQAVVEFAVTDAFTELRPYDPAAPALWVAAGRLDAPEHMSDVVEARTPALPAGATVRVRVRGVAPGRIASAHLEALPVVIPATPRLLSLSVALASDTRVPTVRWEPNAFSLGVRVRWAVHAPGAPSTPTDSVDVRASRGSVTLPVALLAGQEITVSAEPWSGWDVAVVSGGMGTPVGASATAAADATTLALGNFREVARTHSTITYAWTAGVQVEEVWIYDRIRDEPEGSADPWPAPTEIADAIVPAAGTYVAELPSAGRLRFLQLEPRSATLAAGAARRVVLHPSPVALDGGLHATVGTDTADLALTVKASPSAYPIEVTLYEDSPDAEPFAEHTFAPREDDPAGERTLTAAEDPRLGGRPLPLREVRRWYARIVDVAGNVAWAFAAADRDALPSGTVTPEDYLERPRLAVFIDDDTDQVEVTAPTGKRTWNGPFEDGGVTYQVGTTPLDSASAEAPMKVDEEREYTVRLHGGGVWVTAWQGKLHGVSSHPPTVRPRMVYAAKDDRADVYVQAESAVKEPVRLYMRDSDDAQTPVYVLVDAAGTIRPVAYGPQGELPAEAGPESLWRRMGTTETPAARLAQVQLNREQIRRFFFRAEGVQSGVEGPWTPLTLSAQRFPWLESVDLVWDETAGLLRMTAVAGAFCASGDFEFSSDAFATAPAHRVPGVQLAEGAPHWETFAPAATADARNRVWYARVIPYNDLHLEGKAQQDTAFVPAEVRVVRTEATENAQGTEGTLTVVVEDPGGRLTHGVFYVSQGRGTRREPVGVEPTEGAAGMRELELTVTLAAEHVTLVEPTLVLIDNRIVSAPAQVFDTNKVPQVADLLITPGAATARIDVLGDTDCDALHLEERLEGAAAFTGRQDRDGRSTSATSPFIVSLDATTPKQVRVWGSNVVQAGPYVFATLSSASAPVTWQVAVSEDYAPATPVGRLDLTLSDPSGRVGAVSFVRQSGTGDAASTGPVAAVNGVYTCTVELDARHTSSIAPVIELRDGTTLRPGSETFDLAREATVVSVAVAYSGTQAFVHAAFDTDTASGWYREVTSGGGGTEAQFDMQGRLGTATLEASTSSTRLFEAYGKDAALRPGPAVRFEISQREEPPVGHPQLLINAYDETVYDELAQTNRKQGVCTVGASTGFARIAAVGFDIQSGNGEVTTVTPDVDEATHLWKAVVRLDEKHLSTIDPTVHLVDGTVIKPGPQTFDIDDIPDVTVSVTYDGQGTAVVRVRGDSDTALVEWFEIGDAYHPAVHDLDTNTWVLDDSDTPGLGLKQALLGRQGWLRGVNAAGVAGPPVEWGVVAYYPPPAATIAASATAASDGMCPYLSVINTVSWEVTGVDDLSHFVVLERAEQYDGDAPPASGADAWTNRNFHQNLAFSVTATHRPLKGTFSDRFPAAVRDEGDLGYLAYAYFVVVRRTEADGSTVEVARALAGSVETGPSYCTGSTTDEPRFGGGVKILPE